ncbi:MAG: hypothetical protein HQK53_16315, partial [Oligoflexia bacterium]|nr:hypothetical protein [Oligoflexia bacterium]
DPNKRLSAFYDLLKTKDSSYDNLLMPKDVHVSFDNHSYHILSKDLSSEEKSSNDRGEFADILIQDRTNSLLLAIEVKYLSSVNFNKDIMSNKKRLEKVLKSAMFYNMGFRHSKLVLLVDQSKWNASKTKDRIQSKIEEEKVNVAIVFWQDMFMFLHKEMEVEYFMGAQLSRKVPEKQLVRIPKIDIR